MLPIALFGRFSPLPNLFFHPLRAIFGLIAKILDYNSHYIRSRTNRVRKAMFPEFALDELEDKYANAIPQTSKPSLIEMLAEPSQDLKLAIIDLIHLQDESEAIINALPELIRLLADRDPVRMENSFFNVYR